MKPLSVGNVVSAGLRIYRDNFWKYFKLAFIAYLWVYAPILIVGIIAGILITIAKGSAPVGFFILLIVAAIVAVIYGWAKFSAISALIARLAYGEVTEKPETVKDAQRYVKPRMWKFLIAGILVGLIIFGAMIPYSIIMSIIDVVFRDVFNQSSGIGIVLGLLLIIAGLLFFLFGLIWLISRLLLVELPLAVEENVTSTSTISRSWNLTQGSVGRIQLIVFIGFIVSIPIFLISNLISFFLQRAIGAGLQNAPVFAAIGVILYVLLTLAGAALIVPFWQSIKAVIYCDLKVRREGMGLDLKK